MSEHRFGDGAIVVINESSLFLYENRETPYGFITEIIRFVNKEDGDEKSEFPRYVIRNALGEEQELFENCFRAATDREIFLHTIYGPIAPGDNQDYIEYCEPENGSGIS